MTLRSYCRYHWDDPLVVVPLLYTHRLPNAQLRSMLTAPAPPLNPPVHLPVQHAPTNRVFHLSKVIAPVAIPRSIPQISDAPPAPGISVAVASEGTQPAGNPLLFGSNGPAAGVAPAPPPVVKSRANGPLRMGGNVAEANLIYRVNPVYPALAKSARIQGTVEFSAIISKDGRVENLKLISGHPLLVNAARDAILQWRYRPTRLNGEPVEVMTTITVHFRLSM